MLLNFWPTDIICNRDAGTDHWMEDVRQDTFWPGKTLHSYANNVQVRTPPFLKRTVSRDGYFFEGLNILVSTVCADGFHGHSEAFYYPIQFLTFYLLLWNYLLILKMLTKIPFRIPLSVIGRCSIMPTTHWLQGKCARINLSKAASCMILQNHRYGFLLASSVSKLQL